jgi:predicted MPP superfamily phosphohydrolase
MLKKLLIIVLAILLVIIIPVIYVYIDNHRVKTAVYTYSSEKIPENFDGFKICVVTDFHSSINGGKVADAVRNTQPDIICIAGDLVNMNDTDFTNARNLVKELCDIGKVYFSYGNHEIWSNSENKTEIPVIKDKLKDLPVTFMNDEVRTIEKDGQKINLIGYGDDVYDDFDGLFEKQGRKRLTALHKTLDPSVASILVMHRAQYFKMAAEIGYDVVLSGHLHGGHIGIKKIQSCILKEHFGSDIYSKGEYTEGDSRMYVSGGLANKNRIPRIFNTPEIMVVELDAK